MESYFGHVWLTRLLFQRALAANYLVAFLVVLFQFPALLGEHGLLPVAGFVKRVRFRDAPSIFQWRYSDRILRLVAWIGIVLSVLGLTGASEAGPLWMSIAIWLVLWALYLSVVNVGQNFYAFGWESMLLEAGFFAAFLGPTHREPSLIPILILRWMLFRTELGAGLIKLRHDRCWRELTCLFYHYETQPLPNPLSWYFHRLPKFLHRVSVLFSHFVQLIVPFGLFAPQPIAMISGGLTIFHQLWLIISGNYSWLNWLTVVLGISAFDLPVTIAHLEPRGIVFNGVLYALAALTAVLSVKPVLNLFSRHQLMNYSYNRFHLVNTYGAFGSVTKKRYEIVIEGTTDNAQWQEYEFKGKPGDPQRMPPQVAPYHLRLDWLMWFLPFSVLVTERAIVVPGYDLWFIRLVQRLLDGDGPTLKLLRRIPFEGKPSRIRALFYLYRFTAAEEKRKTRALWSRELIDVYLPPVALKDLRAY